MSIPVSAHTAIAVNQTVTTPLGKGVVQGRHSETEWLVRLPINEVTQPHLRKSETPRATLSGLWIFSEKELK